MLKYGEFERSDQCFNKCIELEPQEKYFYQLKLLPQYGFKNFFKSLEYINTAIEKNKLTECKVEKDLFDLALLCEKGILILIFRK